MKLHSLLLALVIAITCFNLGLFLRAELLQKTVELKKCKAVVDEIEDRMLILSIYGEDAVGYFEDQDAKVAK